MPFIEESDLLELHKELREQSYSPKSLKTFILRDPKTRKISKSYFKDRIVHHALVRIIEPIFDKTFIYDSCANRIEKGLQKLSGVALANVNFALETAHIEYSPAAISRQSILAKVEQLGYSVPDWVVTAVGDGCIISGQWKAFKELRLLGRTDKVPRMLAVQASGCKPVVDAFHASADVEPTRASTIADSIRVGQPRNWRKALRAIRDSGGNAVAVSDDDIISAILLLGRKTGIFAEPAGATGLAGLRKAIDEGIIGPRETVAVIITGSGLKDPQSLEGRVDVVDIGSDVASVEANL